MDASLFTSRAMIAGLTSNIGCKLTPETLAAFCASNEKYVRAKLPLSAVEIATATSWLTLFKLIKKYGGSTCCVAGLNGATPRSAIARERAISRSRLARVIGVEHAAALGELAEMRIAAKHFAIPSLGAMLLPIRDKIMSDMRDAGLSLTEIATTFGVHTCTVRRACRRAKAS